MWFISYNIPPIKRIIRLLVTKEGKIPFREWYLSMKDAKTRDVIRARLKRLNLGNFGDCRSVGKGVYEFRIHFGPGIRIYFGLDGKILVLLILGGTKGTQTKDIEYARGLWAQYWRENE